MRWTTAIALALVLAGVPSGADAAGSFDLALDRIWISPASPSVGATVTVTVRVRCVTGRSQPAALRLYDGRPHPVYLSHDATLRRSRLVREIAVPPLASGKTRDIAFTLTATDQMHDLWAWLDPGRRAGDSDTANNLLNRRFRPAGGSDLTARALHVVYRNCFDRSLSDAEIAAVAQTVRAWAKYLWDCTLCVRISVDLVVIDRRLQIEDFSRIGENCWLAPEDVEADLAARGIDLRTGQRYKFMIVNHTNSATSPAPMGYGGLGYFRSDLSRGLAYQNIQAFTAWWNSPPAIAGFVHEGFHGIEGNYQETATPTKPFPPTHYEGRTEDAAKRLEADSSSLLLAGRTEGGLYNRWILETWPTLEWLKLNGNVSRTRHGSDAWTGGAPGLSIARPLAGEAAVAGGLYPIRWTETNVVGPNVRVYFFYDRPDDSQAWIQFGDAAPGTLHHPWRLPSVSGSMKLIIGAWDWDTNRYLAVGSVTFSAQANSGAPSLRLLTPGSGARLKAGAHTLVSWTEANVGSRNTWVYLFYDSTRDKQGWLQATDAPAGTGELVWKLPSVPGPTNCFIGAYDWSRGRYVATQSFSVEAVR